MATTWCWEKISGACGCRSRENPHENRPGLLGPVNVETIRIYPRRQENRTDETPQVEGDEAAVAIENSDGERGSAEESAGPSLEAINIMEDPDAIHVVGEEGDAELVVERSVEEVEVTEEAPKLSRFGRLKALFGRGIIHRLRRLSDEAMHRLNIPEHVQLTRRRERISQVRNWRDQEWKLCTCFTGGRRCCRRRKNLDRAVHFGPEPDPDHLIEEELNLDNPIEEDQIPPPPVIIRKPNDPHIL